MITLDVTWLVVALVLLLATAAVLAVLVYQLAKRRSALIHRRIDELAAARDDLQRHLAQSETQLQGGIDWLVTLSFVIQASERVRQAERSGRLSPAAAARLGAYFLDLSREGLSEVTRVAPDPS